MAQSTPKLNTKEMDVDDLTSKTSTIGTDATQANNPMLHRGGSGELEVVSGDDATVEGTRSPNKVQLNVKNALIGTNVTLVNNVKLHRGGVGELGFVLGDDTEAEGSRSNKHATIQAKNIILGDSVNQDNNIQLRRAGNGIVQFTVGSSSYADGTFSPDYADVLGSVPVGSIVAWNPGYYLDSVNGTFVNADFLANNNISAANSYLNPRGYYVANGAAPGVVGSLIWNSAGRYLPELTDDRFLMGASLAGDAAGSNTLTDHTHGHSLNLAHHHVIDHGHLAVSNNTSGVGTDSTITSIPDALKGTGDTTLATGTVEDFTGNSGSASTDVVTGTIGSGVVATSTENRPKYLGTFFIVRVF